MDADGRLDSAISSRIYNHTHAVAALDDPLGNALAPRVRGRFWCGCKDSLKCKCGTHAGEPGPLEYRFLQKVPAVSGVRFGHRSFLRCESLPLAERRPK